MMTNSICSFCPLQTLKQFFSFQPCKYPDKAAQSCKKLTTKRQLTYKYTQKLEKKKSVAHLHLAREDLSFSYFYI